MTKRKAAIVVGALLLLNAFQCIDRYILTRKLAKAYQAQINFERASDIVIKKQMGIIEKLYNDKCGEVFE